MMTERILARAFSLERRQLMVAVAGVAFAVFLMVFQGSLLCGFLRAASAVPSATAAEVWMTPRGLDCFDFSGRIPARYGHLSAGVPGVRSVSRMAVGFASWKQPGGTTQIVEVIGAEPDAGARLPLPRIGPSSLRRHAALVDASARANLGLATESAEIEVNGRHLDVHARLRGFGSFLGSPYLFTGYEDAEEILGFSDEETSFLLVDVDDDLDDSQIAHVVELLRDRFPEVSVRTRDELAAASGIYWIVQTGAGGGIALAGLLGFLVGSAVVSQTMATSVMERIGEVATLKALGGPPNLLRRLVVTEALRTGFLGWLVGLALVIPGVSVARRLVAWIWTPLWLPPSLLVVSLAMCGLASLIAAHRAVVVDPELVFRE
jgi:putative ABC transport system permease protein